MRVIYKIAKSELGTLFYSPIAWLILVIFVFQVFGSFANLLEYTVNAKTLGQMQGYQSYNAIPRICPSLIEKETWSRRVFPN